jgi:hypothetical protein
MRHSGRLVRSRGWPRSPLPSVDCARSGRRTVRRPRGAGLRRSRFGRDLCARFRPRSPLPWRPSHQHTHCRRRRWTNGKMGREARINGQPLLRSGMLAGSGSSASAWRLRPLIVFPLGSRRHGQPARDIEDAIEDFAHRPLARRADHAGLWHGAITHHSASVRSVW